MGVVREPRKGLLTGLCQPIGWKQSCVIWDSTLGILIYCVTEDVIHLCIIACIMKDCTLVWIRVLLTPGIYMPFQVHSVDNNSQVCNVLWCAALEPSTWVLCKPFKVTANRHSICTLCINRINCNCSFLVQKHSFTEFILLSCAEHLHLAFWLWDVQFIQLCYYTTWPDSSQGHSDKGVHAYGWQSLTV